MAKKHIHRIRDIDELDTLDVDGKTVHLPFSDVKIKVYDRAMLKIIYFTRNVQGEVGGLMIVSRVGNNLIVEDVLLLKQKVSGGDFELDAEGLINFTEKIADKNKELLAKIKGWWHSHDTMGTFWSGTDDNQFNTFLSFFGDYCLGVVTNKHGHYRWRLDVNTPFGQIIYDTMEYSIVYGENKNLEQECRRQIKKMVKKTPLGHISSGLRSFLPSQIYEKPSENGREISAQINKSDSNE